MRRMSEHTGLIRSYQLLVTAACTNTSGKMKGWRARAADRCPFVHRNSKSQVTSFMGFPVICCRYRQQFGAGNVCQWKQKELTMQGCLDLALCLLFKIKINVLQHIVHTYQRDTLLNLLIHHVFIPEFQRWNRIMVMRYHLLIKDHTG